MIRSKSCLVLAFLMYSLHQSQTIVADDLDTIGSTKLPKELPEDRVHYHVCHQWPKSNGRQLIDPDGHNVGENPIKVDCNSGVTTLNHDHARLNVTVQPCDDLGCYSLDLQYESVIQAKAIVEKSSKCQQSIGVICQTAPLQFNGNNHGWWIDAEGSSQYFFNGDKQGNHSCKCGESNSCIDDGDQVVCNCNAKLPESQFDIGYITAMDLLPITGFRYGPIKHNYSSVSIFIGPLQCTGLKEQLLSSVATQTDSKADPPANLVTETETNKIDKTSGKKETKLTETNPVNGTSEEVGIKMTEIPPKEEAGIKRIALKPKDRKGLKKTDEDEDKDKDKNEDKNEDKDEDEEEEKEKAH